MLTDTKLEIDESGRIEGHKLKDMLNLMGASMSFIITILHDKTQSRSHS